MGQSYNQGHILKNISLCLKQMGDKEPKIYRKEDIDSLTRILEKGGYCHGLSMLYCVSRLNNDMPSFFDNMRLLSGAPINLDDLPPKIRTKLEGFIGHMIFLQNYWINDDLRRYMGVPKNFEHQQKDISITLRMFGEDTEQTQLNSAYSQDDLTGVIEGIQIGDITMVYIEHQSLDRKGRGGHTMSVCVSENNGIKEYVVYDPNVGEEVFSSSEAVSSLIYERYQDENEKIICTDIYKLKNRCVVYNENYFSVQTLDPNGNRSLSEIISDIGENLVRMADLNISLNEATKKAIKDTIQYKINQDQNISNAKMEDLFRISTGLSEALSTFTSKILKKIDNLDDTEIYFNLASATMQAEIIKFRHILDNKKLHEMLPPSIMAEELSRLISEYNDIHFQKEEKNKEFSAMKNRLVELMKMYEDLDQTTQRHTIQKKP